MRYFTPKKRFLTLGIEIADPARFFLEILIGAAILTVSFGAVEDFDDWDLTQYEFYGRVPCKYRA